MIAIIQQYSFATLVANTEKGIEANHLPVVLKQEGEKIFLNAHIAKANPLWKNVKNGSDVLVIFNGPQCYVSPNHYPTKAENGKAVPTWNYVAVHAKGKIFFKTEEDWKYNLIDELTVQHESASAQPWSITDAPEQYIQKMLPAIVGLEIDVTAIDGQWKLSQNQPEVNREGVIRGLSALNDPAAKAVAAFVQAQRE